MARAPAGPVLVQLTPRPAPTGPGPWFHLVTADPPLVLLVERSALFEVDPALFAALAADDPAAVAELAGAIREPGVSERQDALQALGPLPAPRAISLNVAQSCNLACSYCYADEGRFGGSARRMPQAVARRAVDELLAGATPGDRVLVGFIGGEPLLNRVVVHDLVAYASAQAGARSVRVGFSLTTNGTLLQPADIELLRAHRFTVTASIDGSAATHDRHRSGRHGEGSWQRAIDGLRPLLEQPGQCRLSARSTVTRDDLDIPARVQALTAVGFRDIGVSPARTGPDPALLLQGSDWGRYLDSLIAAAEAELIRLREPGSRRAWLFSNLGTALREIHRGTARPLPCGAGYGYVSVDVDGAYATCHRTVGDPRFRIGALGALDDHARGQFLAPRLVDRQEPCRSCWARYLCGGGCHAEVSQVGRENCDMIRGWLDYCLGQYPAIRAEFPELLASVPEEVAAS